MATFLGAALALATAILAIATQRSISKRKNTLDVIMQFGSDPTYRQAVATYRQFRDGNIDVESICSPRNDADLKHLDHLNTFWNWHEAVALGIRRETLDDEIMLRWWGEPMVATWNASKPAIDEFRRTRGSRRTFKNYEIVAREFARRVTQSGTDVTFDEPEQPNKMPYKIPGKWFGLRPPPVSD